MLSFEIDKKITEKLWSFNHLVAEKFQILNTLPKEELQEIHRYARISMIGASTRIENAVLTDAEIDWLDTILGEEGRQTAFEKHRDIIEDKLSKDRERSIEEVAGCRAMLHLIYEQAKELFPLTESAIRGLHHELLRYYSKAGPIGKYKTSPNRVIETNRRTREQRVVLETAYPGTMTEVAMTELVAWYNEALVSEAWSLAVSCEFVFRFLAIHPFQDGNGRLGRGLFLLSLLQSPNSPLAFVSNYLAIDRQIEKHKEEYYLILHNCSDGKFNQDPSRYHINFFLHFMLKILEESLTDIDVYRARYSAFKDLSPSAFKVLECFKDRPEMRLQTKDICEASGIPRRTVLNALSMLVEEHFIRRFGKGPGVRYQLIF